MYLFLEHDKQGVIPVRDKRPHKGSTIIDYIYIYIFCVLNSWFEEINVTLLTKRSIRRRESRKEALAKATSISY